MSDLCNLRFASHAGTERLQLPIRMTQGDSVDDHGSDTRLVV